MRSASDPAFCKNGRQNYLRVITDVPCQENMVRKSLCGNSALCLVRLSLTKLFFFPMENTNLSKLKLLPWTEKLQTLEECWERFRRSHSDFWGRKGSRWKRQPDPIEGRRWERWPDLTEGRRGGQTLLKAEGGRDDQTLSMTVIYPLGMEETPQADRHAELTPHRITDERKLFRQGLFFLTFCISLWVGPLH